MIVIVTCHIGYCLRLSRKTPSFFCCCCYCCGFCSLFLVCFFALWSIYWRKKKDLRFTQTPISSPQNREENVTSSLCDKRKWFLESLGSCVAFVQNFKVAPPCEGLWVLTMSVMYPKGRKKHTCQTCSQQCLQHWPASQRCSEICTYLLTDSMTTWEIDEGKLFLKKLN